jgi:hypothetical protein
VSAIPQNQERHWARSALAAPRKTRRDATIDGYVGAAKVAAGTDWAGTFLRLCVPVPAGLQAAGRSGAPRRPPARETWYAEPAKVR